MKQESPAWVQEAYRPRRILYMVCAVWGEGVGGTPVCQVLARGRGGGTHVLVPSPQLGPVGVPPSPSCPRLGPDWGTPLPPGGQTENITFPSYNVGSNNLV